MILIFYGLFLFYKIDFLSLSINDLGRHIKNGEMLLETGNVLTTNFYSYTEPDFPFINHHWLSGAVFYFLHETVGFGGMVIFKILVLLTAFALVFLASMKKADFWLTAFFSLPAILILRERAELRPEIFSYLFIALFLYFLIDMEKHPERKRIFWLVPLQLLWVNMHTFFFIGILLTAGFLLEKIILNLKNLKNNPLVKKLSLLLIFLIAVIFINPNGFKGALYPLNIFNNFGFKVSESQSLFSARDNYWWDISIKIFMPMVFLLASSFLLNLKRKPIFYFLAGCGSAAAVFLLVRALPLFGLIFLPAVSSNFNVIFLKIKMALQVKYKVLSFIIAGLLIYASFMSYKTTVLADIAQETGIGLAPGANAAAIFFKEQGLKGPIFNNYDIGSYLIYHLFPKERVFVDNRPEAYPTSFFRDIYYPMIRQEEKWLEVQEKYNFNAILWSQQTQSDQEDLFFARRINDPSWSLVYADAYAAIFLKNNQVNQDMIKKFQITRDNINEKTNYLQESNKLVERIAAVNLFMLYDRQDLLIPVLQEIADRWPGYQDAQDYLRQFENYLIQP